MNAIVTKPAPLKTQCDALLSGLLLNAKAMAQKWDVRERGAVLSVAAGVARVGGLPGAFSEEILQFPNGLLGTVFNADMQELGVVLLGDWSTLRAGSEVERTGRVVDVPVGDALLGRVVSPLGKPLDGLGAIQASQRWPVERPAPPIIARRPVSVPLQTGVKAIDALVPIGRGQRELIIGDRQTGKTALAAAAIANQKDSGVICVYCAIGQKADSVFRLVAHLRSAGVLAHCVIVVAEAHEPPGLLFVAPYAATSIAENFMQRGKDVLVVYDDLTHHARAYREVSLLLKRPPGREAFPGDIFYVHSRLLERSTHLCPELGGGSLTALPIVETEAQNIAGYIPTNLISITDGQIYLSPTLFSLGVLPAIDVGKSVSRVGGKAQLQAYRAVVADIKLSFSQFEELERFSRFDARIDDHTKRLIDTGRKMRLCFSQRELDLVGVGEQIHLLNAIAAGVLDNIPLEHVRSAETLIRSSFLALDSELVQRILGGFAVSSNNRTEMARVAASSVSTLLDMRGARDKGN
jgi:F-type H+-transporting ATPase subunit alpha